MADSIASPSRDNQGRLTTPGAAFVGDLEAVIAHAAEQLVIQAAARGESLAREAALELARAEVWAGRRRARRGHGGHRLMALVRFLVDVGGAWAAGSEVELPEEQAAKWADGYRAEYVEPALEANPAPAASGLRRPGKPSRA